MEFCYGFNVEDNQWYVSSRHFTNKSKMYKLTEVVNDDAEMNTYSDMYIKDCQENIVRYIREKISDNKITSERDFINKVLDDYRESNTELNLLFFDFDVKMPVKDIITGYAYLQDQINGDTVVRNEGDNEIRFDEDGFIPDGKFETIYEGSAMKLLEKYNSLHIFKRYCDDEEHDFIL